MDVMKVDKYEVYFDVVFNKKINNIKVEGGFEFCRKNYFICGNDEGLRQDVGYWMKRG